MFYLFRRTSDKSKMGDDSLFAYLSSGMCRIRVACKRIVSVMQGTMYHTNSKNLLILLPIRWCVSLIHHSLLFFRLDFTQYIRNGRITAWNRSPSLYLIHNVCNIRVFFQVRLFYHFSHELSQQGLRTLRWIYHFRWFGFWRWVYHSHRKSHPSKFV